MLRSKLLTISSILFLLYLTFSFLFKSDLSFDQDLGRHVKLGEIIWTSGEVPKTNLFSYTYPDFPFINHHYLFEFLSFLTAEYFGFGFLLIIKILVVLLAVCLTLFIIPGRYVITTFFLGFIFLHVLRERLELRPEIFSFLFTALTYFVLEKFSDSKSRLIYLLIPLQFLWINTHIYFPIGLILQFIFLVHLFLNKEQNLLKILLKVFILSIAASLTNPSTIQGFLYPLQVFRNYGYTIVENQNIFFLESLGISNANYSFAKICYLIILASIIISFFQKKTAVKNLLISLLGLTLALVHVRSLPYLFFLSFPAVIFNLGVLKINFYSTIFITLAALILVFESIFYLNGDYYKYNDRGELATLGFQENIKPALDFTKTHSLPTPIFNNFDIGSYIEYRGYPKYKTFIDGRPEAYPASFFSDVYIPIQYDFQKFKDQAERYNFKTVIFSHTDQTPWGQTFLKSILKSEDWKLVYLDSFTIILLKDTSFQGTSFKKIDLSNLDVSKYNFKNHVDYLKIGLFLITLEEYQSANNFINRSLEIFPNSPLGSSLKIFLASNSKNQVTAQELNVLEENAQPVFWW